MLKRLNGFVCNSAGLRWTTKSCSRSITCACSAAISGTASATALLEVLNFRTPHLLPLPALSALAGEGISAELA